MTKKGSEVVAEDEKNEKEEGKNDSSSSSHPKKKKGLDSYIWYIVGGVLGLVVVIYYFMTKSASSTASQIATTPTVTGGGIAGGSYPSSSSGGNSSPGTSTSAILSALQSEKKVTGKLKSQLAALKASAANQTTISGKLSSMISSLQNQVASSTGTTTSTNPTSSTSTSNSFITFANPQSATVSALASNHPISIVGLTAAQVGYLKNLAQRGLLAGITANGQPVFKSVPPTHSVSAGPKTYLVQSGNTLSGIAASHGISLAALEQANPHITNPNMIYPNQTINLPYRRIRRWTNNKLLFTTITIL